MNCTAHRQPRPHRASRGVRAWAVAVLFAGLAALAPGAAADVRIEKIDDFRFGTWAPGGGAATATRDFCVQSDFFGVFPLRWSARIDDREGISGSEFLIEHKDGGDTMIVDVRLVDLRSGASTDMEPGVATGFDQTGDTRRCPNGLNARLEIRIDSAQIASGIAGRYEGRFELTAARFGTDTENFRIRIDVPDLVQVSGLDDIDLGVFPGAGDMTGGDRFCVYRNDDRGRYELEARGQGPGNEFVVEQGVDALAFEVEFDDGSGFTRLDAGRKPVKADGADTRSTTCRGAGSAQLRVTVPEAELLTAAEGAYVGTLTLTVAPI